MNQGKEDLGTRHVRPSYILPLKDKKYIYIYICRDGNPRHPNTSRQIRFRRVRRPFALCSRKKVKVP